MTNGSSGRHEERISRLEMNMATLAETAANTQEAVRSMQAEMKAGFSEMAAWQRSAGRTNWGVFAALIAVSLTLVGAFASPYVGRQGEISAEVKALRAEQQSVDRTRWTRDDAMREVDRTDAEISELRQALAVHDRDVSALNARQSTRLEAVERNALGLMSEFREHVSNGHPHTVLDRLRDAEREILALRQRLGEQEKELARRSAAIDFVEAEQARRRPLVYDSEK